MVNALQKLRELAAIAAASDVSSDDFVTAAQIIRRATGAREALIIHAQDDEFLFSRDGEESELNDISQGALLAVQRNLTRANRPVAFKRNRGRMEEFRDAAGSDDEEYLAFHIPTTEGFSEMCLLRGPWPKGGGPRILRFVESALPALTLLMERSLNAERSSRHEQQLEAIANAAQVLTRAEDMRAALTDLASSIASTTGFDYVVIDLYDPDAERFVLRVLNQNRWANTSLTNEYVTAFNPDRPDDLTSAMLATRKPLLIQDLQHDAKLSESVRYFFMRALLASGAILPMTFQDELQGAISFAASKPHSFPPGEVETLQSLASQMATALKAMRMYGELARSREEIQRYAARVERQQTKLKRQSARLRELASRDALTGMYNYGHLHEVIDRQLARSRSSETQFAIILGDLDDFKLVNDTYGHLVGDQALRVIAGAIRSASRNRDVIGRYGGDEFMIILPNTERARASKVAQRILAEVARLEFRPETGEERIPLPLALGIAVYPDDGQTKEALIGHADAAMYEAKGSLMKKLAPVHEEDGEEAYPVSAYGLLDGLVRTIDRRDHYTRMHSEHDAEYAVLIGEALGHSRETLRALRIAGLLHDVGKIGISDRILRKPGPLTKAERETMQQHVLLTERIIGGVPHVEEVIAAASSHHERFDGTGYPRGLKGEEIPLLGRILAVADAFSAMTEDRPYRKALSWEAAVQEIRDCSGTQFDPAIVQVFISDALPQIERRRAQAA